MCYSEKVKLKANVFLRMVKNIQSLYNSGEINTYQKELIETTIGAGIMYIGGGDRLCWSGKMSANVIRMFLPDSGESDLKYTRDHEYPRKFSAKKILEKSWPDDVEIATAEFLKLYRKKYGRVNYVTKKENSDLNTHVKSHGFSNPRASYRAVGIELKNIDNDQLKKIKKNEASVINEILN
jgi:hypothetical protein